MSKILDLPGGWEIHHEYTSSEIGALPMMIHRKSGRRRSYAGDVAHFPEGRAIFVAVKRWLDEADERMGYGAQSQGNWKAMDKAKMAIEDELRKLGKWDDSLLGIEFEEAS